MIRNVNRRWWITAVLALILADLAIIAWFLSRASGGGRLTLLVFVFALSALIPLAALIGAATERLGDFLGPVASGLLTASLSNVPELAIGIFLLIHARVYFNNPQTVTGDFEVIRGLLIGSVINNILLTLGLSVFIGALRHGRMRFDAGRAAGYASMLALAVVGLALPNLANAFAKRPSAEAETMVSVLVSAILIITYITYVGTQVFRWGERRETPALSEERDASSPQGEPPQQEYISAAKRLREAEEEAERLKEESEQRRHLLMRKQHPGRFRLAILGLAAVTAVTVVMAFILVSVTDNVIRNTGLTPLSTGLILFPIVCNLGEAAGALRCALSKDMETAMSIAAGSSVQIPLFVTPLLVFISLGIAAGGSSQVLTLTFPPAELIVAGLVTFVYALVNLDGETTWLEGLQLLAFYVMVAVTAFALPGQ
ncbi:MAG: hypothetical protein IVW57_05180 [Ktedonobacterales bacterium]|nr:hypothetical protein [Ktedonobacterales bacterium]